MKELFAACSKVDIFQWEQDTSDGRGVLKYHEKAVEVQEQEVQFTEQDQGYDIFGPKDMTDPSAVSEARCKGCSTRSEACAYFRSPFLQLRKQV